MYRFLVALDLTDPRSWLWTSSTCTDPRYAQGVHLNRTGPTTRMLCRGRIGADASSSGARSVIQWTRLSAFYECVVTSATFCSVVCCESISTWDTKRLDRLGRRASSILDFSLDSVDEVCNRRMLARLTAIANSWTGHPIQSRAVGQ